MYEKIAKWTSGVAGLCLLCCALPLTLAFIGGGSVAAFGLLKGEMGSEMMVLAGITIMAFAAWAILRRRRKSGPACDIK
jgi:LPXTG-motif cell wall-anchored protein